MKRTITSNRRTQSRKVNMKMRRSRKRRKNSSPLLNGFEDPESLISRISSERDSSSFCKNSLLFQNKVHRLADSRQYRDIT